jgi:UDP-3-O-[3-hydroxymyristoyl] glucosamine N-acyltransferase
MESDGGQMHTTTAWSLDPTVQIAEGVTFGRDVQIAPGVVLGSHGFGYERDPEGKWRHREHSCGVVIGNEVTIHANTVIDRGRWRDTVIGDGSKIDANVFVAHNVHVGARCLIIAGTSIGGSCNIGDDCWLGIGCTIRDNINIADRTIIGAGAVVVKDIDEPGQVWCGNPARYLRDA